MERGFRTYKKVNTMGMSQVDLILTVYRGAIGYLDNAQVNFNEGNFIKGRTACEKARKCIVHLYTTLDMEKGESIATQLSQLYVFMIKQIDLAVAGKSCRLLIEVKGILETIKDAWKGLKEQENRPVSDKSSGTQTAQNQIHVDESSAESLPSSVGDKNRLTFSA
jgi:flagellar protein FliS